MVVLMPTSLLTSLLSDSSISKGTLFIANSYNYFQRSTSYLSIDLAFHQQDVTEGAPPNLACFLIFIHAYYYYS